MAKAEVITIRVPKWVTYGLLLLVSAAMVGIIYLLSGRAYEPERASIFDFIMRVRRNARANPAILATLAPLIVDVLFFVPWGAVAFLAIDRPNASRRRSYGITMMVGVAFALGLLAWQETLPTRVTGWVDAIWNAAGCFAGALAGHARRSMYVRFE